ncbi:DUF58 domain-containing protein [Salinicoccus hispanicus]|uniref:DUF58 domain-containing protein n=2 Tax=Salinicoccus hispanicus TaxID=157225 RepID=A0A6N8U0H6_9STAP|nr:DUF58 domain-containing protein [Salinicoccus hispanicus]MXQ51738.1 DUF58 domain-containing protein [Salinicoccus hispanicus]
MNILYSIDLNPLLVFALGLFTSFFTLDYFYEKTVPGKLRASISNKDIRLFKDQEGMLEIEVRNEGWMPILNAAFRLTAGDDIQFEKDISLKTRYQTETISFFTVMPKSSTILKVPFRARKRGVSKIIRTDIEVPRIFGFGSLFLVQSNRSSDELLVYPEQLHTPPFDMRNKMIQGLFIQKKALFNDPMLTVGTRDYHQRDSMRDVHWKSSAKTGELQTRIYEKTTHLSWMVAINLRSEKNYAPPANIEEIIENIAYLTSRAAEAQIPYSVFTNLSSFDSHTFLSRDEGSGGLHYRSTLETLARINTLSFTLSFDRLLKHIYLHKAMPSHLLFTGRTDPAIDEMLLSFQARGVEIFQIDESGVLPYDAYKRSGSRVPS